MRLKSNPQRGKDTNVHPVPLMSPNPVLLKMLFLLTFMTLSEG